MAVPKKRKTKSGTRQRRSHHSLSKIKLGKCANCGASVLPHQVCPECGSYRAKKTAKKDNTKAKVSK